MALFKRVDLEVDNSRGSELSGALYKQFNDLHSKDFYENKGIETLLLKQKAFEVDTIGIKQQRPDMCIFSPSGASKCEKELYFKLLGIEQHEERFPYQKRWTRNATAIHEVVQRDLLYSEVVLKNPSFKVMRMENGLPAWEKNLKNYKIFTHNGVTFAILGMMDGILNYKDGSQIGYEFKTKSTTIGTVGHYKMKDAAESHKQQCVAYSLLFGMDEFLLMYESLAKDGWSKGSEAKIDFRVFYYKVTKEDQQLLLDKFAKIVTDFAANKEPIGDLDKCIFCPYKYICKDYIGE